MARDMRSKMKMPSKPAMEKEADEELSLDFPMEDEMAADEEADMDMGMEMPEEEGAEMSKLEDISDDELMAEMARRGLEPKDESAEEELAEEETEDAEEAELA